MVVISLATLLTACAPAVDPGTGMRLIAAESAGRQFAININGQFRLSRQPISYDEFKEVVYQLDVKGYNFDFGFAQANNREIKRRGYAVNDYIDACSNLRFMQEVLSNCYTSAPGRPGEEQMRIGQALSCYNTGRYGAGFANGYVARVYRASPLQAQNARAYILREHLPHQLKEQPL